jgi:hypothetical protein
MKSTVFIVVLRGGREIFIFHFLPPSSSLEKGEGIESFKALKCWFTGTKVGL